jgi:hypothetical protein
MAPRRRNNGPQHGGHFSRRNQPWLTKAWLQNISISRQKHEPMSAHVARSFNPGPFPRWVMPPGRDDRAMGQEHALLLGVHKILVLRADRIAAACGVRRRASGLIAR